jgi:hypothetical protein
MSKFAVIFLALALIFASPATAAESDAGFDNGGDYADLSGDYSYDFGGVDLLDEYAECEYLCGT